MRYLGIDFGLKRVGLAVSEGELASPWQVVKGGDKLIPKLLKLINQENFEVVVIGQPEGSIGKKAAWLAGELKKNSATVVLTDETLSSKEALRLMIETGVSKKKRRVSDAQAAAIILQNYLDQK